MRGVNWWRKMLNWEDSAGDVLTTRLGLPAQNLVVWSAAHYNNLSEQIKNVEKALGLAQQREISEDNYRECLELEKKIR